jgi:hypothetical protein
MSVLFFLSFIFQVCSNQNPDRNPGPLPSAKWIKQTSGVSADLRSVCFTDANTGWAAGLGATVLKTANGGISWQRVPGITATDLYSVSFADASTGTMAATGKIFYTTNGVLPGQMNLLFLQVTFMQQLVMELPTVGP